MLVPIILEVLVLSVASGLKICEDCVNLNDCMPAIKESEMTEAMLNSALCGSDSEGKIKICCSDITAIREIVNHTNLYLLPKECGKVENNSYIPWIANIYYKGKDGVIFACVGTLINSRYVLTTANCLNYTNIVGVRICSDLDCDNNYQKIGVTNLSIHEGYNISNGTIKHDIGLLRLKKTVNMPIDNAGAICLPVSINHWQVNLFGTIATASGWASGMKGYSETNYHRFQQTVSVYNPEMCEIIARRIHMGKYKKEDKTMLCAGCVSPDWALQGSAGSALMVDDSGNGNNHYVQYGILSYGARRCDVNRPEFYTDVRSHMKWILDNIEE